MVNSQLRVPKMKRKASEERPIGAQVRAQRKFAQGVTDKILISSTATLHVNTKRSPAFSTPSPPPVTLKPQTEDFINFLCYRGTPALPPCLTFFNYGSAKSEEAKSKRINEQEAKFAITALKLKYQEKRLSIVSTLAKKVKERRVILTRSRGVAEKTSSLCNAKKLSSKSNGDSNIEDPNTPKKDQERSRSPSNSPSPQLYLKRNAPSPDIIDGVQNLKDAKREQNESNNKTSAKPARYTPDVEPKCNKKSARDSPDLNPKIRLTKTDNPSSNSSEKKSSDGRVKLKSNNTDLPSRVTTRALRRKNSSPLRELPMVKKPTPSSPPPTKRQPTPTRVTLRKDSKTSTSSSDKNSRSENSNTNKYARPTRKTKENATIYMGLINKDFSSDEDDEDLLPVKNKKDDVGDSSSDSSSSSETKFLEKQYNASLKRDETSRMLTAKKKVPDKMKKQAKSVRKPSKPEKRILRSHSHSQRNGKLSEPMSTRRGVILGGQRQPGAARKSGARRPRPSRSGSDDDDNNSSSSSESDNSSTDSNTDKGEYNSSESSKEDEEEEPREVETEPDSEVDIIMGEPKKKESVKQGKKTDNKKVEPQPMEESEQSESESEDEMSDKQIDEEDENESLPDIHESGFESIDNLVEEESEERDNEEEIEAEDNPERGVAEGTVASDADLSTDIIVEKVSIAIQVDMDLDEEEERKIKAQEQQKRDERERSSAIQTENRTLFRQLNLETQRHQEHRQASISSEPIQMHYENHHQHSSSPHIARPIIPQQLEIPPMPSASLGSNVFNHHPMPMQGQPQHCSMPNIAPPHPPPTILSFNTITSSFTPYGISHPMLPFGCASETTSTSISSSLDTHIRTVAANLDIRLVRPPMAPGPTSLAPFPFSTGALPMPSYVTKPVSLLPEVPAPPPVPTFFPTFRVPPYNTTTYTTRPMAPLGAPAQYQAVHHQMHTTTTIHAQQLGVPLPPPPRPTVHSQGQDLSLIQNLPNVSIVPRFDRNSKVVILPNRKPGPQQHGSTGSASSSSGTGPNEGSHQTSNSNNGGESGKKKGSGRKRQQTTSLPLPSSPLTVRKDSTNPATYSGSASKKNLSSSFSKVGSSSSNSKHK